MKVTRREAMKMMAGAIPAFGAVVSGCASSATRAAQTAERIQPGPFQATWESLISQSVPRLVPRREVRHLGALVGAVRA